MDNEDLELCQFLIERVIQRPNGCWIWQKAVDRDGYGIVGKNKFGAKYRKSKAHQLSYIAFVGMYNPKDCILHSCHTPSCINPKHLRTGTYLDNINDRVSSGRGYRGAGVFNSRAKLDQNQVNFIRNNKENYSKKELAEMLSVSIHIIRNVINGKTYK